MLIAVPLTVADFAALRSDGLRAVVAYAATPGLYAALGYTPDMDEDAEFAALTYASVAALTRAPRRLVAVATVPDGSVTVAGGANELGAVEVAAVEWRQVGSLFIGEDPAAERDAAGHVAGRRAEEAWETEAVADLVESSDLLWYAPDEADAVAELILA